MENQFLHTSINMSIVCHTINVKPFNVRGRLEGYLGNYTKVITYAGGADERYFGADAVTGILTNLAALRICVSTL